MASMVVLESEPDDTTLIDFDQYIQLWFYEVNSSNRHSEKYNQERDSQSEDDKV